MQSPSKFATANTLQLLVGNPKTLASTPTTVEKFATYSNAFPTFNRYILNDMAVAFIITS